MNVSLGRQLSSVTLYLIEDSAFADTVTRSTDWDAPPVIEFNDGAVVWTSVLDPTDAKVAVFTETRATVALRTSRESWRLRDVTTDEILARGSVSVQGTS